MKIAEIAADLVRDDSVIGLGTGRTAATFIRELGLRVGQGLRVRGVATSVQAEHLARQVGVPLATLDEVPELDIAFDGADAIDDRLDLVKGLGGALLREKVIASAARRFVVLVDAEKLTPTLGLGYCRKLPVEVVPFALPVVARRLDHAGIRFQPRTVGDPAHPFVTDNGNAILDLDISHGIADSRALDLSLRSIPGVAETGLFLGMAHIVLVQREGDEYSTLTRDGHDATSP